MEDVKQSTKRKEKQPGRGPKNLERTSAKVANPEEVEEEEEEKGEVQKEELVDKVQRKDRQLLYGEAERRGGRKERQEE